MCVCVFVCVCVCVFVCLCVCVGGGVCVCAPVYAIRRINSATYKRTVLTAHLFSFL